MDPLAAATAAATAASPGRLASLIGHPAALKIMPLGASITYGTGSTDGNGYRAALRTAIVADGAASVDMVGSQSGGTMADRQCEAWPGWRLDQVAVRVRQELPSYRPSLVLINIGTNDARQGFYVDTFGDRMASLLDLLGAGMDPGPILVSTLLVSADAEAEVDAINGQIAAVVKAQQARGRPVLLVQMHDVDGLRLENLPDGTHPDDEGYRAMARIWWQAMLEAAARGFFAPAAATNTTAAASGPPGSSSKNPTGPTTGPDVMASGGNRARSPVSGLWRGHP